MILPCQYCGKEVERWKTVKKATCFPCNQERNREYHRKKQGTARAPKDGQVET